MNTGFNVIILTLQNSSFFSAEDQRLLYLINKSCEMDLFRLHVKVPSWPLIEEAQPRF